MFSQCSTREVVTADSRVTLKKKLGSGREECVREDPSRGPAGAASDSDMSGSGIEPAPAAKRVQNAGSLISLTKVADSFAVRGL